MAQKGSILVVDDERGVRELLQTVLNPYWEVHTATDGQEALQFIEKEQVDLVTLDLKMPRISGMEVLREIRKIKADIDVVIITGFGTITNIVEAIRYGAVDIIPKPFDLAEIISTVRRSFERRGYNPI